MDFIKENLWVWATALIVYLTLSGWVQTFVGWLSILVIAGQIALELFTKDGDD
jgi:hypothetical protein